MRPFLYLIPLLPLLGFLFNFTIGVRVLGRRASGHAPHPVVSLVAAGSVFLSFLVAVYAVVQARPSANHAVLFVGWEGVGLCSYLRIGFWFHKQSASDAGMKPFIANRIGDAGFLAGMFLVFVTFGTLDLRSVMAAGAPMPVELTLG